MVHRPRTVRGRIHQVPHKDSQNYMRHYAPDADCYSSSGIDVGRR